MAQPKNCDKPRPLPAVKRRLFCYCNDGHQGPCCDFNEDEYWGACSNCENQFGPWAFPVCEACKDADNARRFPPRQE